LEFNDLFFLTYHMSVFYNARALCRAYDQGEPRIMLMRVDLRTLVPNPFRDIIVDPIDHKPDLQKSINDDGFWGGCVIRKNNKGQLEIAAGHSRVKEALACNITHAELFVADISDEVMVRIYARENATQRPTGNALAGSIAAAIRQILLSELVKGSSSASRRTSQPHVSEKSQGKGGGRKEYGIGRDRIMTVLKDVPFISINIVDQQLANLKESGDYDRIVDKVVEEIEAEHKAAIEALERVEKERQEAEKRALEAKKKREEALEAERKAKEEKAKQQAEARRIAAEAEEKAATEAREKAAIQEKEHEATRVTRDALDQHKQAEEKRRETAKKSRGGEDFDWDFVGVSKHLKTPKHVVEFRKLVTSPGIKPYLPKEGQAGLAAKLVAKAEADDIEFTSAFIRDNIYGLVTGVQTEQRRINNQRSKSWQEISKSYQGNFAFHCRGMVSSAADLVDHNKKRPKGITLYMTSEFKESVESLEKALTLLKKEKVI